MKLKLKAKLHKNHNFKIIAIKKSNQIGALVYARLSFNQGYYYCMIFSKSPEICILGLPLNFD